nr:hypothetical protein [uncultured Mediterranean phage uvMED]
MLRFFDYVQQHGYIKEHIEPSCETTDTSSYVQYITQTLNAWIGSDILETIDYKKVTWKSGFRKKVSTESCDYTCVVTLDSSFVEPFKFSFKDLHTETLQDMILQDNFDIAFFKSPYEIKRLKYFWKTFLPKKKEVNLLFIRYSKSNAR